METKTCPNCKAEIKPGFFSLVSASTSDATLLINKFGDGKSSGYCSKCSKQLIIKARQNLEPEYNKTKGILSELIGDLPIVTIHQPMNWDYNVIGIITAQSVMGTGVISEISSSFTDFFGAQSGAYNKKLQAGENTCMNILRKKAIDLGGNAIIGVDIDYSEAGGDKGMLMICMAGTAVYLKNPEVCVSDPERIKKLLEASQWWKNYSRLIEIVKFV
jgi:uncharacterized protein YbjQ (UPF0145 family)